MRKKIIVILLGGYSTRYPNMPTSISMTSLQIVDEWIQWEVKSCMHSDLEDQI